MKVKVKTKREKSKCYKCVWGTWLSPELVFCMFPYCLKEGGNCAKKAETSL
jgi:hypothetical protein